MLIIRHSVAQVSDVTTMGQAAQIKQRASIDAIMLVIAGV